MHAISVKQHLVLSMLLVTAMVALFLAARPAHAASTLELDKLLTAMMALSLAARASDACAAAIDGEVEQPPGGIQKNREGKRLSRDCAKHAGAGLPGGRRR